MDASDDDRKATGGKWTDETLSMSERHRLLLEELQRMRVRRPDAGAGAKRDPGPDPQADRTSDKPTARA